MEAALQIDALRSVREKLILRASHAICKLAANGEVRIQFDLISWMILGTHGFILSNFIKWRPDVVPAIVL